MTPETAPVYRLAICATFTAEPIAPVLSFWAAQLGWTCNVQFAPYHQVFQQLLDANGLLAGNRTGVNLVLVRLEDWLRAPAANDAAPAELEEHVTQFLAALHAAARSFPSPIVVCPCPPSPAFLADSERAALHARLEERVAASLVTATTVHLATAAELSELYPVDEVHDPHADDLGHVPYTAEFFAALGTLLMRKVHALRVPPFKVIVLDCDDTLWKGVCGEDGPQGIALDAPRRAVQEFMAAQHASGRLLCLASKNNLADVLDTFRMNPRMPLRLDHFTSWRINWEPKAAGLAELAEELELSLASFILVDDNPKEVSEVAASHPEVLGLPLPADAEQIAPFLRHVWAFDQLRVTAEDQARNLLYAQQAERSRARSQSASLEEFLASLALEVQVKQPLDSEWTRIAQLTQRTNQMNFTTIRRTESEVRALCGSGEAECLAVHVRDRFGDYGLAGVVLFRVEAAELLIDTFLLSCRALGRGVEHRMMAALGRLALDCGLTLVEAPFVRTAGNLPALLFLESAGLAFQHVEAGKLSFRFPATYAAAMRYRPGRSVRSAAPYAEMPPAPAPDRSARIPYVRIATDLRDVPSILRAISPVAVQAPEVSPAVPPRADLEQRLRRIWAETLAADPPGLNEDFFHLGGHSLLAVQLMSRVRREFDVELSLELVYSGAFTVTALADAIELKEFERSGAEEYEALLRELEGLTDEQVRELLAREDEMPQP